MAKTTNRQRLYKSIATIRDLMGVKVPGANISINISFNGEEVPQEPKKRTYCKRHGVDMKALGLDECPACED